jgi:hypothetical protein
MIKLARQLSKKPGAVQLPSIPPPPCNGSVDYRSVPVTTCDTRSAGAIQETPVPSRQAVSRRERSASCK